MPSWSLDNAAALADQNKYTFYRPSAATIAQIKPGEHVKLIFTLKNPVDGQPSAERMWVMVESIDPDGTFNGYLDNDPAVIKDLRHKDQVKFRQEHIANTMHDGEDADSLAMKYSVRCYATVDVLEGRSKVSVMQRTDFGMRGDLNGWVITGDGDPAEYFANPEAIRMVSLGAVLRSDDSILPLLESPIGSAYMRLDGGEFTKVDLTPLDDFLNADDGDSPRMR